MVKSLSGSLLEKAVRKKIPIAAHLDLTYRCNLRCIHCYVFGPDKNRAELDTSEMKSILDQLANAGTLYLTLSGGEILVRKDFLEIASYARKLNFALRLLTNGTLINGETAGRIASLNPQLVGMSIYSANPIIHDRVTGQVGSLQKSLSAAAMLRERNVKVRFTTMIMKQNVNDYHSVYELAQRLGAEFRADHRIAPKPNKDTYIYPSGLCVDESDLYQVLSDPIFLGENEEEVEEPYPGVFNIIPCGAGYITCCISPYGDVYPCVLLPINCGNIKEKPFIDIWKKSYWMRYIRSIIIPKLPCSKCNLLKYCRPCIAFSYFDGDILKPSERVCLEAKILKKLGKERK